MDGGRGNHHSCCMDIVNYSYGGLGGDREGGLGW